MTAKEAVLDIYFQHESCLVRGKTNPVMVSFDDAIKAAKLYARDRCKYQRMICMLTATEAKAKDIHGLKYIDKIVKAKTPKLY